MQHRHWIWLAALAAGNAGAQSTARPDPADPAVRVPETAYRSAFEDYRRHELSKQTPWREANDDVGRIGGHTGVLRGQPAHGIQAPAAGADGAGVTEQGTPRSAGELKTPQGRQ